LSQGKSDEIPELVYIYQTDVTPFSEEVLNDYVTHPNPTPTLPPNRNSSQINKKYPKQNNFRNWSNDTSVW
jgi:hypothetical protein